MTNTETVVNTPPQTNKVMFVASSSPERHKQMMHTLGALGLPDVPVHAISPSKQGVAESQDPSPLRVALNEKALVIPVALGLIPITHPLVENLWWAQEKAVKPLDPKEFGLEDDTEKLKQRQIEVFASDVVTKVLTLPQEEVANAAPEDLALKLYENGVDLFKIERQLEGIEDPAEQLRVINADYEQVLKLYTEHDTVVALFSIGMALWQSQEDAATVQEFEILAVFKPGVIGEDELKKAYMPGGAAGHSSTRLDLADLVERGLADVVYARTEDDQLIKLEEVIAAETVFRLVRGGVPPLAVMAGYLGITPLAELELPEFHHIAAMPTEQVIFERGLRDTEQEFIKRALIETMQVDAQQPHTFLVLPGLTPLDETSARIDVTEVGETSRYILRAEGLRALYAHLLQVGFTGESVRRIAHSLTKKFKLEIG